MSTSRVPVERAAIKVRGRVFSAFTWPPFCERESSTGDVVSAYFIQPSIFFLPNAIKKEYPSFFFVPFYIKKISYSL